MSADIRSERGVDDAEATSKSSVDPFGPSTNAILASARKQPGPERPEDVRRRQWVILSFWVIVVFLGLPVWRWTTSIYRAKLPLQEMMEWADGKACRMEFPLQIYIEAPSLQGQEAQHLVRLTQHALDDLNEFSQHHLRLQLSRARQATGVNGVLPRDQEHALRNGAADVQHGGAHSGDAALVVRLHPREARSTPKATLEAHSPIMDVNYSPNQVPSPSSTSSPLASYLASQLRDVFAEERAMIAHVLSRTSTRAGSSLSSGNGVGGQASHNGQTDPLNTKNGRDSAGSLTHNNNNNGGGGGSPLGADEMARQITRTAKHAPTYHLTFSLFTPDASPSSWEIESALREHLQPLLYAISTMVSNFTIDTQVQMYAKFSHSIPAPEYDEQQRRWTLRKDHLSGFINAAEWPLSPSIGGAPTLNFVVYVPSRDVTPLVIKENGGNSWLVPQWGGLVILNRQVNSSHAEASSPPESTLSSHVTEQDLHPALITFSHQLLSLLGAPLSPPSLPLRLMTLTRLRCATLLLSASSTLGALARLTEALRSISIPSSVATHVEQSIEHLAAACALLAQTDDTHHHHSHSTSHGRETSTPPSLSTTTTATTIATNSTDPLSSFPKPLPIIRALSHAREAERHAERAFFDKSMVGQVYFPDEHKVAVYLPLLGPIGVPLVVAAVKEISRLIRERRRSREEKRADSRR
ncbi:MAG: GPI transamidase component [Lichina confinis]|nr:MAG: GPI transamidase component [Lichina confinis]